VGWIENRVGKDGGKAYLARYYDPTGHPRSKAFTRKLDAQRWITEQEYKLDRGEWIDPKQGTTLYEDWARAWLARQARKVTAKTYAGYESLLRSRVLPVFGTSQLRWITQDTVQEWIDAMADEGLSSARIRQGHQVLSASLEKAVNDGLIAKNPCAKVELPPVQKRRQLFLTAGQLAALVDSAERQSAGAGVLVLTLGYSGLRWGEATALQPQHLDTGRRRIRVVQAWSDVNGELILGSPKTHETRTVIVPSFVADRLEAYLDAEFGGRVLEWVFPAPNGGPLRSSNFRKNVWLPAVQAAPGVPDDLLIHDLRDTAASLAISSGAPIKAVQRMLGHASAAMTLDTYGSLYEDDLEELADRIGDKFGAVAATANVVSLPVPRPGS
jgi:integrase